MANDLISSITYDVMDADLEICQALIETGVWEGALEACSILAEIPLLANPGINVRKIDSTFLIHPRFMIFERNALILHYAMISVQ